MSVERGITCMSSRYMAYWVCSAVGAMLWNRKCGSFLGSKGRPHACASVMWSSMCSGMNRAEFAYDLLNLCGRAGCGISPPHSHMRHTTELKSIIARFVYGEHTYTVHTVYSVYYMPMTKDFIIAANL